MSGQRTRYIAGCMSGTSLDGLDVALVRVLGSGLEMKAEMMGMASGAMEEWLRSGLERMAGGGAVTAAEVMRMARGLGKLHAGLVAAVCGRCGVGAEVVSGRWSVVSEEGQATRAKGIEDKMWSVIGGQNKVVQSSELQRGGESDKRLDLVAAHGQTVWHLPGEGLSWQLFEPWAVARELGVRVCFDLRGADLSAGGQGAPITPVADWVLFRNAERRRVVVNLGGICNMTVLEAGCLVEGVRGEDVGPCNLLIDGVVRRVFSGLRFDEGGKLARGGRADEVVRRLVMVGDFFGRSRPRTTGREDFGEAWVGKVVEEALREVKGLGPGDLAASAVEAVAWLVAEGVGEFKDQEVVLAGGGARNDYLVERIRMRCGGGARVVLSDDLGVPCEGREAVCMAVLGALAEDGVAITLGGITGAKGVVGRAGAWVG